jgi:hypothetical protein
VQLILDNYSSVLTPEAMLKARHSANCNAENNAPAGGPSVQALRGRGCLFIYLHGAQSRSDLLKQHKHPANLVFILFDADNGACIQRWQASLCSKCICNIHPMILVTCSVVASLSTTAELLTAYNGLLLESLKNMLAREAQYQYNPRHFLLEE